MDDVLLYTHDDGVTIHSFPFSCLQQKTCHLSWLFMTEQGIVVTYMHQKSQTTKI